MNTPPASTERRHSWVSLAVILLVVMGGSQAWSWWRSDRAAEAVRVHSAQADITMFTTDTCPYCEQARQWLNHHQATWQECNIDQSQACQRLFQARGSPGVPLLHVNGLWRLGFDPVWLAEALQSSPKTDKSPRP